MSDAPVWYIGNHGQQTGPVSSRQIVDRIRAGQLTQAVYVYGPQLAGWTPIAAVPEFASAFHPTHTPPPSPPPRRAAPAAADQIDYEIAGSESSWVEITLDPGEACVAEPGALFYLDPGIELDPPAAGETIALTGYRNADRVRRRIAFAAPAPGRIVPLDLREFGGSLRCQGDAFLCAAKGISLASPRALLGRPGVAGLALHALEGAGLAFAHAGGTVVARDLLAKEGLRVDAACVLALEARLALEVQPIPGPPGAAGPTLAFLVGPGRIWLRSLPPARLVGRLARAGGVVRADDRAARPGG
jgi:uncharacterized protein (AIM24 family)